jgi:A/G-specific adenine glycosylase
MSAAELLRKWFHQSQRRLPWRDRPIPYAVWVSEVMLQQTQAAVVVPYFYRWMEQYPSIAALATASVDEVIKSWEGLGYYSRARNLHRGARTVMERHGGLLPADRAQLLQIPGIGAYTANAILAFAFHQKITAVDGNVLRVICRYFGLEEDIAKPQTRLQVQEVADGWLPDQAPWEVAEALIELGAVICGRSPACHHCPLQQSCSAYHTNRQSSLPVKSGRVRYQQLHRVVAVVIAGDQLLLRRGRPGQVMADLYEFPYFASEGPWNSDQVMGALIFSTQPVMALDEVSHTFTRYRVRLYPWLLRAVAAGPQQGCEWIPLSTVRQLPFSSGHRRILHQLLAIDLS